MSPIDNGNLPVRDVYPHQRVNQGINFDNKEISLDMCMK